MKKWRETFFCVKNIKPEKDLINLLPFVNVVLAKLNWGFTPGSDHVAANSIAAQTRLLGRYRPHCHFYLPPGASPATELRGAICRLTKEVAQEKQKIKKGCGGGEGGGKDHER
jgi:hypothetical protein